MSKTDLKKELANLNAEQLRQLILDTYSARKEFKVYFDFFVNPEPQKLYDKYVQAIAKELDRRKYGSRSKARISTLKKLISEFESFHPGYSFVEDLMLFTVSYALLAGMELQFADAMFNGIAAIMRKALDLADLNNDLEKVLEVVGNMLGDEAHGSRYFRRYLRESLEEYLSDTSRAIDSTRK